MTEGSILNNTPVLTREGLHQQPQPTLLANSTPEINDNTNNNNNLQSKPSVNAEIIQNTSAPRVLSASDERQNENPSGRRESDSGQFAVPSTPSMIANQRLIGDNTTTADDLLKNSNNLISDLMKGMGSEGETVKPGSYAAMPLEKVNEEKAVPFGNEFSSNNSGNVASSSSTLKSASASVNATPGSVTPSMVTNNIMAGLTNSGSYSPIYPNSPQSSSKISSPTAHHQKIHTGAPIVVNAPTTPTGATVIRDQFNNNMNRNSASSSSTARPSSQGCSYDDTLIVFDWDDTFFPTSALERHRLLRIPCPKLRPQVANQLAHLAQTCYDTICAAEKFGRVVIITNSAPGWCDTSCAEFLPSLLPKMRSLQIFAKPMNYMLTFKMEVFKREVGQRYSNIVSFGDGISERTATLRLINGQTPGTVRHCKSVKFKDLPTMAQLTRY